MTSRRVLFFALSVLPAFVVLVVVAPAALSARGAGTPTSSLSVRMVYDANGDGAPNWNDRVTFDVSTSATDKPYVRLDCYQGGTWVSTMTVGLFAASPWQPNFTLASTAWTGGSGNCDATLFTVTSNGRSKTLSTLSFVVAA